jgi:diguanylate cyclase (GGDEF)-like protein/PAS domain S-box-containing protein
MARVLLPVVVAGPLILGGLRFAAQELGWIGLRVGLSVYTLSMIFVLAILVFVVAGRLRRSDLELRRLAAIVDASDDAMINRTAEGVILSWNRAAERMYGYSVDEVVGRPVSMLASPDHPDEIPALLERVRHGEVQRVETERVCRDGTRLSVALTVSPIRDQTGRVVGASTTARDITERKESERQLEHTARLLAEAQAIAGLGSWERDMQAGTTTWTDQVYEIFGVDRALVAGDPAALRELVDADDLESYEAMLVAVQRTGTPNGAEFRFRRPDGERRILQSQARLAERDGHAKLVGTVMDITETRGLQEQLTAARDLFGGVLDAATETSIIGTDPEGVITVFNRGAERMLGRSAEEMIGRHTPARFHDAAEIARRATELGIEPGFEVFAHGARAGGSETREWSYMHADGRRLAVSLTVTAVRGERGEVKGFIGVARDVTAVRHAEAARRQAEQRFEAAFEYAPIGVAITGMRGAERGRYLHANETFARLLGREPGELDGMAFAGLTHPDDLEESTDAFALLGQRETIEIEKRYLHRDGRAISVLVSATPILDEADGQPLYCVSHVLDISERKRFESELRHLADHDVLTGLDNRQRFESELARIVEESRRYGRSFALLALDLDGFKQVNDRFGHPAGDQLLTRIGGVLRQSVRETDIVARVGGDEFAIILHEAGEAEAIAVAEKVLDAIRRGGVAQHGRQQARITSSIGITTLDGDCMLNGEELVVEADIAMYEAKSDGRDDYAVFDRVKNRRGVASKSHSWLERLGHAIDNDLFVLHAQPIIGICANGIPHYELLVRMLDDHGDLIFPPELIIS